MRREILVSKSTLESRVALLEDGRLAEFMFDRPDQGRIVGNIYLGRVEAVLPGIQASFVDIGMEKAGFLHVSDVLLDDEDDGIDDSAGASNGGGNGKQGGRGGRRGRRRGGRTANAKGEGDNQKADKGGDQANASKGNDSKGDGGGSQKGGNGGKGRGRRRRKDRNYPPIQSLLTKGQQVIVQVTKEPISTKGPRLTRQISLAGRFLVYMPYSSRVGVSRKIDNRGERGRLRKLVKEILPKDSGGVIVRTVGEDFTRESFERDFNSLKETWEKVEQKAQGAEAPAQLHAETHLVSGVVRDLFSGRFESLTVDDPQLHSEVHRYLEGVDSGLLKKLKLYEGSEPLFDKFGVEEQVQVAFSRKVDLASGGHIVIEQTEALVSIDVNTGKFTGKKDAEATILKTNLDAAREIARQLRLRDIGGIIVCDFIDMESQKNRDKVLHELRTHLGHDRARTKTFEISELGLIEMTRQRIRPSLFQTLTEACPQCGGKGRVYSPPTVMRSIERAVNRMSAEGKERDLVIRTHPEVALYWLESEPDFLDRLGQRTGLNVDVRDDPLMSHDEFRLLVGPAKTDMTQRYVTEAA